MLFIVRIASASISDVELEEQINDRFSFRRFVGLRVSDDVPDATTFCCFRQELLGQKLSEKLFQLVLGQLLNMIRHGMAFYKFYSKLSAKISENLPNLNSKSSKYRLFTVFGYEHNMVKAIPCHVGLFIPVSHMAHPRISRWDSRIEPFLWPDYNSGSAEPFRVTPPEAVV